MIRKHGVFSHGVCVCVCHACVQVPSVSPHALSYDTAQAARQFLEVARATISEIPSKITFCKQRRTQAEGLLKLGSKVRRLWHPSRGSHRLAQQCIAGDWSCREGCASCVRHVCCGVYLWLPCV